ncbi:MAG: hydantoinase B/oxoprolinase family protein [Phycisphaerales bacterium]
MTPVWKIAIDTGGTFTDCIAREPDGAICTCKVLSDGTLRGWVEHIDQSWPREVVIGLASDTFTAELLRGAVVRSLNNTSSSSSASSSARILTARGNAVSLDRDVAWESGSDVVIETALAAPLLAAHLITLTPIDQPLPAMQVRLATTRATNMLLERNGAAVALFITEGFADLLRIGDQTRSDLFALPISRPLPIERMTFEVSERIDAKGNILIPLDEEQLLAAAAEARSQGITSAAVSFLNSYANPVHEERAMHILRESCGFESVVTSTQHAALIGFLPRTQTAVVDAFVGPGLHEYFASLSAMNRDGTMQVMSSAGGLVPVADVRPADCLVSGPAGGVVGAAAVARRLGYGRIIAFDMGGTSTDVTRVDDDFTYRYSQKIAGVSVQSPALAIETVAAGGGSICECRHGELHVGPRSAGATPGPACYGRGGPLTLTDVNLLLHRIDAERFAFPVNRDASQQALEAVRASLPESRATQFADDGALLEAFLAIADERMADAIGQVTVRDGIDPAEFALVAFGGAAGQHACRVAQRLGMKTVLLPVHASILSAKGVQHAALERIAQRQVNLHLEPGSDAAAQAAIVSVQQDATRALRAAAEHHMQPRQMQAEQMQLRTIASIRCAGQHSTLDADITCAADIIPAFTALYRSTFGHSPPADAVVELESLRAFARNVVEADDAANNDDHREENGEGVIKHGPLRLAMTDTTFIIEPGWIAEPLPCGTIIASLDESAPVRSSDNWQRSAAARELFTNRLTAIAIQMGEQLERTALSTNVKDRRDFSCAILTGDAQLLINAPHVPVHLGGLGMCVREVRKHVVLERGNVIVTNHPAYGGSHLPDVTVIAPVYVHDASQPVAYVANRAHHAEIGGTRPGSMPADATCLGDEGVIIPPMHLVRNGEERFDDVAQLLRHQPNPSRDVRTNLADLRAQVAAVHRGVHALDQLIESIGIDAFNDGCGNILTHASAAARTAIADLNGTRFHASDALDDGSVLAVTLNRFEDGHLHIDFSGTSAQHAGNLNATPAIVRSVIVYIMRLLAGSGLPLNEGMLDAVEVVLPHCLLNPHFPAQDDDDAAAGPAIVGGNTEISQRLTDLFCEAMSLCANGPGTMNNILFGNDRFAYYETVGGGSPAGPGFHGTDAVHCHMTNTRMTDAEILEQRYPVQLNRWAIRKGSGGGGRFHGGEGIVREITFLEPLELSVLTQRRTQGAKGLGGGGAGLPGSQTLLRMDGSLSKLASVDGCSVGIGDRLILHTPGGGGFGKKN